MNTISDKELKKLIAKNPVSKDLPEDVKALLIYKCKELVERGTFEAIDLDILALYAVNITQIRQVDERLSKEGQVFSYTDRYGNTRISPHPLVKVRKDLVDSVHRTAKLFGFSPLDAQALPVENKALREWEEMYGD